MKLYPLLAHRVSRHPFTVAEQCAAAGNSLAILPPSGTIKIDLLSRPAASGPGAVRLTVVCGVCSMRLFLSLACLAAAGPVFAADPLAPGLAAGQRPGPYSSLVSVGSQRGQMHCFICETKDSPAVIVFAR